MTLTMWEQLGVIGAGASVVMLAGYLVQLRTKDAGIVDALWALSLAGAALFAAVTGVGEPARRTLMGVMVGIWGVRLGMHVLMDRVLKGGEDGRYADFRVQYGAKASLFFAAVFGANAVLIVLLSLAFVIAGADAREAESGTLGIWQFAGAALWVVGIVGEWIADRQLLVFKRDAWSKGKVCEVGLWRYSRHPNYFFEWVIWCGFATAAVTGPHGSAALIAPVIMLVLITKVTGIPPTEARSLRSRPEAYRRYQQTTSAFVPWFRKESAT